MILFLTLLCWSAGYVVSLGYPLKMGTLETPLWLRFCSFFPDKLSAYLIGFLLMVGGGYLLHRVSYTLVIIREKTWLPFLLFGLFQSTNIHFFPLKSTSVAIFCLLLGIYILFASYHSSDIAVRAYVTALILGLGSLLWVHLLWFFPLFWMGMYRFRVLNPRSFTASLLGVVTVYFFLLAWCVWKEDFSFIVDPFVSLFTFRLMVFHQTDWLEWVSLFYLLGLIILSSVNVLSKGNEYSLRSRQYLSFLMQFVFLTFILLFFYEYAAEEILHVTCIPASVLIAHYFTTNRSRSINWLFLFSVLFFPILLFLQLWNFS